MLKLIFISRLISKQYPIHLLQLAYEKLYIFHFTRSKKIKQTTKQYKNTQKQKERNR